MRLPTVNCVLLACLATSIASDESMRPKRDLVYLKNIFASMLFGSSPQNTTNPADAEPILINDDGNVKIFRIPGFDNILVKAVPKGELQMVQATAPIPDKPIAVDPSIAIVESYLGTKTPDETISALQGIRNLLQSGILLEPKPLVVVPGPPKVPLIPVLPPPQLIPPPVPFATEIFPVKPFKVQRMPVHVPSKYSYELIKNDGSDMRYIATNSADIPAVVKVNPYSYKLFGEVLEPAMMPPPPTYIVDRIEKVAATAISPKLPKVPTEFFNYGYVHTSENGKTSSHPRPYIYQNPALFEPLNQRYVYRHPNHYMPHRINIAKIEDKPCDAKVEVFDNYRRNEYAYPSTYKIQSTSGPSTYPYKQIHHSGITVAGVERNNVNPVLVIKSSKMMPVPPLHIINRIEQVASTAYKTRLPNVPAGYSFKIVNNTPYPPYDGHAKPTAIQANRIRTDTTKTDDPSGANTYSYTQTHSGGMVTTYSGTNEGLKDNTAAYVSESTKGMPGLSSPFATPTHVTHPPKILSGYLLKTVNGGTSIPESGNPGEVKFKGPVSSSYTYRQINHSNPKPFTIVPVGNVPAGYETMNAYSDQVRSDGTKYSSSDVQVPNLQENVQTDSETPSQFVFVPPAGAMDETPVPTLHNAENEKANAAQSVHKRVANNGAYFNDGAVDYKREVSPTEIPKVATTEKRSDIDSLAKHPIVVAPVQESYSYTQNKADGSSISVRGNSGQVSVKVNEVETTSTNAESYRGDIPQAVS